MKKRVILVLVFAVSGCADDYTYVPPSYPKTITTTRIISEPLGARIELDDDFIGVTPLMIQWEIWQEDGNLTRNHIIRALPVIQGQFVQTKHFYGELERVIPPKTIFFDMNLEPVPRQYDINIQ